MDPTSPLMFVYLHSLPQEDYRNSHHSLKYENTWEKEVMNQCSPAHPVPEGLSFFS